MREVSKGIVVASGMALLLVLDVVTRTLSIGAPPTLVMI